MQRVFLLTAILIVAIVFALQGLAPTFQLPDAADLAVDAPTEGGGDLAAALVDIYFEVDMLGLQDATAQGLEKDFDIPPHIYSRVFGKYTDGRFGIADVIILQPRPGREDECREALQSIKLQRMEFFKKFDVYNAHALAQEGEIFYRGSYYILLMIDDMSRVQQVLEQYIPR